MGLFSSIGGSILGSAAGSALGSIGGSFLDRALGRDDARAGHRYDLRYSLRKEEELWNRAQERGLTPQEYYGSPAAGGAGGGVSGGAQTLGNINAANTSALTARQQMETQLATTKMQTDAQKYAADKQFGASTYSTDKTFEAAMANFGLKRDEYLNVTVPQAAAQLGKTEQETLKLINDVATSTPKFKRLMKLMSMGLDNTLVHLATSSTGLDIGDPEVVANMSEDDRAKLTAAIMSARSTFKTEVSGAQETINAYLDALIDDNANVADYLWNKLQNMFGIQATDTPGPTSPRNNIGSSNDVLRTTPHANRDFPGLPAN